MFRSHENFARVYLRWRCKKLLGVHLVFYDGLSHLGLTYWRRGGWIRRYLIVVPDPDGRSGTDLEFSFTFTFFGPFVEFCQHADELDRVVCSLQL